MPCVFADGWPTINAVSTPLGNDQTSNHTERLEKVLYHLDVSHALPDIDNVYWGLLRRDVSMLLFGTRISKILPGDDYIAENSLVVSVEHQDCTRSTVEQSISTRVTGLESWS